jgi:HD-like signal output (HDOD) protein
LARRESREEWEAEQQLLGTTHAEIGACLLSAWGMPIGIVEACALHHLPTQLFTRDFSPLTAVHVANALTHAPEQGTTGLKVDQDYLRELGLQDRIEEWQALCQERI